MSAAPGESGTAESPHCGGSTELPHPPPRPLQPTPSLATWASFSRARSRVCLPVSSSCQYPLSSRREPWLQPPASFGPLSTRRRATSPQKPKQQPAAPPAVVRAPAKPRSPPRSERQPRPRPEVRPPPAKQRPPQKPKQPPRSSPQRGPGTSRGGSPIKASRFW